MMAKTKPTGLLDEISKLPDMKKGKLKWYERLEADNPEFYAEICSLVDRFLAGDEAVLRKLPTQTDVCRWLNPKLAERWKPLAVQTTFEIFPHRRRKRDGQPRG